MEINARIEKGKLIIEIPTNATPVPSMTGKTLVVASSHGNQPTACMVDGKPLIVGLNAYVKR